MTKQHEYVDAIAASARGPWSEHAFDCARCPGSGCPAYWVGKWERTDEDGVTRELSEEGCGLRLAQSMFVRVLQGTHVVAGVLEQKTKEIEDRQVKHGHAIGLALQKLLVVAAKNSGNPIAAQAAPMIPKIVAAAKRIILPGRKK